MDTETFRIVGAMAEALEALEISYAVGGSVASSVHGEPRSSFDVDILVDLDERRVDALAAALETEFFFDRDYARSACRNRSSFQVLHRKLFIKVDLFVCGSGVLDREQLERRVSKSFPNQRARPISVTAAENIVLRKLDWFRIGDEVSDRQWRDVLGVLKVRAKELDLAYLSRTAERTGLAELLARALREAGIDSHSS